MLPTALMHQRLDQGWPQSPAELPAMVASMQAEHKLLTDPSVCRHGRRGSVKRRQPLLQLGVALNMSWAALGSPARAPRKLRRKGTGSQTCSCRSLSFCSCTVRRASSASARASRCACWAASAAACAAATCCCRAPCWRSAARSSPLRRSAASLSKVSSPRAVCSQVCNPRLYTPKKGLHCCPSREARGSTASTSSPRNWAARPDAALLSDAPGTDILHVCACH